MINNKFLFKKIIGLQKYIPYFLVFIFFASFSTLGIVKHNHFLSGYDLAVIDQAIWKYSQFKAPISTNHAYPFTSILTDHIEFIFILIAPFYWIFNDVRMLIILQALAICASAIPIYLLCQKKGLKKSLSIAILISYLSFYGIQFAIWSDVHSVIFGIAFLAWFLYFLYMENIWYTSLFFLLAIICKEDIALLTFMIAFVHFITTKKKSSIFYMGISILYLFLVFFVYFPNFVEGGYRFQSKEGLLSSIEYDGLYNTKDKREVLLYSFGWFGFLPLAAPIYLLPALGDLSKYFVVASDVVTSGQGIFGHYRASLALLLVWPTIFVIAKFKKLNSMYTSIYIVLCAGILQYHLHLPLSYLTKKWFWTTPESVNSIEKLLEKLPENATVVSQVNMLPHLSHRDETFLLWPEKKEFKKNSPCGQIMCDWFRWPGKPKYMLVDTSVDWDARYWLTNREEFVKGLDNMENVGIIKKILQNNTSILYAVKKKTQ